MRQNRACLGQLEAQLSAATPAPSLAKMAALSEEVRALKLKR